jgi:hypothetical protein
MEEYKKLPEWKEAWRAGHAVYQMTDGQTGTVVLALRHTVAELPNEIAETTYCKPANRGAVLKVAFHRAHDAEFLLYLAVEYGYLRPDGAASIFDRLQSVKHRLFAAAGGR